MTDINAAPETLHKTRVRKRVPKGFKMAMFIDRIGIEFEGGWDRKCILPYTYELSVAQNREAGNHNEYCRCLSDKNVGDGSVDCGGDWNGEVPIGPSKLTEIDEMFKYYPQYGNRTCGMHLHVSFKRQYYYRRLMDAEFYAYFKQELMAWGERYGVKNSQFFQRLRGENHYCKDEWLMELQVNTQGKDSCRYAILNYCYNLHKTLEVRVLPYFKSPETAKAAVMACLQIICDWLYQHRGKRPEEAHAVCELDAELLGDIPEYAIAVIAPDASANVVDRASRTTVDMVQPALFETTTTGTEVVFNVATTSTGRFYRFEPLEETPF